MSKKVITLPNGRTIKYRVTQEKTTWVLIEAIIDHETLSLLDNFSQDVVEAAAKAEETAKEVKPVVEPVKEVKTYVFTEDQKNKMIGLKKALGTENNNDLNRFVKEWSLGNMTSYKELSPEKLEDFVNFVTTQYVE